MTPRLSNATRAGVLALAAVALLTWPQAAWVQAGTPLRLVKGEVKVLNLGSVDRVAVGSVLSNGQLVLLAEKIGMTNMHIWFTDGREAEYKLEIVESPPPSTAKDVAGLLENVKGINVREVNGRAVVEGQVGSADLPILDTVLDQFPDVLNLTRAPVANFGEQMIFMQLTITEVSSNELENLGIDWQTDITGPSGGIAVEFQNESQISSVSGLNPAAVSAIDASPAFGFFGIATQIASRINFLVSSGNALILAEPRLSARSGGEAEFLAGGEVPIPITNALGSTDVEFKEFGIRLKINPVADTEGNITASVEAEVSRVDQSIAVQGIPGFLTRKTQTEVSMRDGQTLVISGLVDQETAEDIDKVKFLGDLPILGNLFRNKGFRAQKRELVIFVTPSIYDVAGEENRRRVQRGKQLKDDFYQSLETKVILD
jgi:pilus assembly protein CpaC